MYVYIFVCLCFLLLGFVILICIYIYIYRYICIYIFTILKWFLSFCLLLQCYFISISSHPHTPFFLGIYFNQFLLSKPIGMRCDERFIYEPEDGLDCPPLPLRPPSVRDGGALPRPLPVPPPPLPPPLPRGPR